MAQTPTHHRVFAVVLAVLFLATSVATGVAVIYQIRKENEQKARQKAIDEALANADGITNPLNTSKANEQKEATVLKGTKLAEFTPIISAVDKLQIIDLKEGTGEAVKADATITAHYTGAYVVNGEIFESSKDGGKPIQFGLNQVIKGWTDGVPGMKIGGIRRLIIPGSLAYGEAPAGYTPGSGSRPMGPLVFDIELVSTP